MVRSDHDPLDSLIDTPGCTLGLRLAHIIHAKEELAVEIGDVNGVHVNDINVAKARQSQVLQNLTTEATCTDTENFAVVMNELTDLFIVEGWSKEKGKNEVKE